MLFSISSLFLDLSSKRIMLTGGAGFPGSFVAEKLKAMPVPHKRYAHQAAKAEQYLLGGGLPELCFIAQDFRVKTLQGYFDVMLFKDLIERYKRKPHAHLLKYFVKRLFAGISSPVSLHKIYNELRSQGYKADKNLLYELMEELTSIYFFFPLRKYSASVIKRETTEKKFYAVDNGLAAQDTRKREFDGLIEACKRLGLNRGTIITMSEESEEKIDGVQIQVVPFYKWALASGSD